MIGHVLAAVRELEPQRVVAVVGHQREQVGPHIESLLPDVVLAVQETQDGTGHAVRVGVETCGVTSGTVLVATGDTPLLRGESLRSFVAEHEAAQRAVSILSGVVPDPHGYGRIVRDDQGDVVGDRRGARRDPGAARDRRDQQRDPGLRRGVPGRGAAADRQRQRQGRVLPDRLGPARPGRRAHRRRLPDRRRHRDRGRQRPRPARRARPAAQPADRHAVDEGRRHGDGPRDDLGRRRRRPRARRDDPARHPAARRDRRWPRTP